MHKRCKRICGVETGSCFIWNSKQMECIADMVLNKVFGVSSCIELALNEESSESKDSYIHMGIHGLSELANWIKYLNIVRDITLAAKVVDEREHERRKESRYPVPKSYRQYIHLSVDCGDGAVPCTLVDFSAQGLRFMCKDPVILGCTCSCKFSADYKVEKELLFSIGVRYCSQKDDLYEVGAEILNMNSDLSYNFFKSVIDALQDILKDQGTV